MQANTSKGFREMLFNVNTNTSQPFYSCFASPEMKLIVKEKESFFSH
jgi:hypothetical protein